MLSIAIAFASADAARGAAAQSTTTHVLVIGGLGGEPDYAGRITGWARTLIDAAEQRFGVPPENITWLAENAAADPTRIQARSTKQEIAAAIERIAVRAGAGDLVLIVLFGHGSHQSGESRFSLPGPDLTAQEFTVLLGRLAAQKLAFVNTTSASGEFVRALSGPNRIIVAATRSGVERNQTRFGGFFVEAFSGDVADTDKDGAVSMLEAFTYARLQTERLYESEQKLATEHAVLDDNGDRQGTTQPDPSKGEGSLARVTFLGTGAVVAGVTPPANASPELRALYEDRKKIEQRIEAWKVARDTIDARRYEDELEKMLVELALKNQEIRRVEGRSR
jgi:hypothetical protein